MLLKSKTRGWRGRELSPGTQIGLKILAGDKEPKIAVEYIAISLLVCVTAKPHAMTSFSFFSKWVATFFLSSVTQFHSAQSLTFYSRIKSLRKVTFPSVFCSMLLHNILVSIKLIFVYSVGNEPKHVSKSCCWTLDSHRQSKTRYLYFIHWISWKISKC